MAKSSQRQNKRPGTVSVSARQAKEDAARKNDLHMRVALRAAFIAAAALWIFAPVLHGNWVWDDEWYIFKNPLLNDPAGLEKIWFQPGSWVDYYPIEGTVLWLQWQFWGDNTFGYHLVNLALHITSALLVWRLFHKLGLRLAWLGGLLFAIHPAQVQSVAYLVELKNTLSLPPFLLALCAWIDYEERHRRNDYLWALGLFLVAMLCKITMAMFPFVILLYAWWKRGRIGWADIKGAAPFFAISLVLGLNLIWVGDTYLHHSNGAPETIVVGGWLSRLALGGLSLAFYFSRCFWPLGLMPVYPLWNIAEPSPLAFVPWLFLAGLVVWLWARRETWGRHALLGLGFFVLMLMPFLGFHTISYMSFTWVMDHLLYIPLIGLLGLIVAGAGRVEEKLSGSAWGVGVVLVASVVILLSVISRAYASVFVDNETLWSYALEMNPQSAAVHNNLGTAYAANQKPVEALEQFQQTVQLKPDFAEAHYNWGAALVKSNRFGEAVAQFQEALKNHPRDIQALNDEGYALVRLGRASEAIDLYQQALALSPDDTALHLNLGSALIQVGRIPEGLEQYKMVLQRDSRSAIAWYLVGITQMKTGHVAEAIDAYRRAIALRPGFAPAHTNLGIALVQQGETDEARAEFKAALTLNPADANAQADLARLESAGKPAAK